jgi:hypothetical protein
MPERMVEPCEVLGGIEINLHWQLDVTMGEDKNRVSPRETKASIVVGRSCGVFNARDLALSITGEQTGLCNTNLDGELPEGYIHCSEPSVPDIGADKRDRSNCWTEQ